MDETASMHAPTRNVWFLVLPRTSMLNIVGPWEVLGHANDLLGRQAYLPQAFGQTNPEIQTRFGLCLGNVRPLPTRIEKVDTVVVAGFSPADPTPLDHVGIVPWLRANRRHFKRVVSVCTGAFALAAAGILNGRRATTHWMYLDTLRKRYPKVQAVDEGVYVADRGVWTSAGVTAGIDLALALVEEDHGHALAMRVAKRMVLFLRRSGNQSQFSSALSLQEQSPPELSNISAFVLEHMREPLPVERIAEKVGMSPRTLSRWCRKHFNESPAELVRRLRVTEARRLLVETTLPLKDVTARTGLGDQSTLWRTFTTDLGVTPAEYRQRFAAVF
jgi:transcriptional regulator GlxA family with amidase domain